MNLYSYIISDLALTPTNQQYGQLYAWLQLLATKDPSTTVSGNAYQQLFNLLPESEGKRQLQNMLAADYERNARRR